jgi:hypothetical protein
MRVHKLAISKKDFCVSTSLVPNQIQIDLGERSYPISIGTQLIDNPNTWANLPKGHDGLGGD